MKKNLLLSIPLIISLCGCANNFEEELENPVEAKFIKSLTIRLPNNGAGGTETRTAIDFGESEIKFAWADKDTVGIFPVGGGQVEFPISSEAGGNYAKFDGGKWALRASAKYAAYFPFDKANIYRDSETILLDYTGQKQVGVGSTKHLGAYDFMGSPAVTSDATGSLDFQLQRFAKPVDFRLTFPESVQISSLRIQTTDPVFITQQILNISGDTPIATPIENTLTDELLLKVENAESVKTGDFYLMMAPQDLTPYTIEVLATTTDGRFYRSEVSSKDLTTSSVGYRITASLEESADYIKFADPLVKQICIETWDVNGDGGLSYEEANLVTTMPSNLFKNRDITSFDEFRFFTNLTTTGYGTFSNCTNLTSIKLPENLTKIGSYSFDNCLHLPNLSIPKGVITIESSAFSRCSALTNIIIPENVTSIERLAFSGCSNLETIYIPDGVTSIEGSAFQDCKNLTSIKIPEGVTSIGPQAFSGCISLINITIPDRVISIGARAFRNCRSLTKINIPEEVIEIKNGTFQDCISLSVIDIPDRVSSIEESAFNGCSSLASINIPNDVTSISLNAFYKCSNLVSINIPEGVTSIESGAFSSCSALTNIIIPESVTSIGSGAFSLCSSLTEISIPRKVSTIGNNAFNGCKGFTAINCLAIDTPTLGKTVFAGTNNCPIYVPTESIDAYKEAWNDYADRILAIE